jgi:hypothetical protein
MLLRPWRVERDGQKLLERCYWHPYQRRLSRNRNGVDAFCNEIDLLTLKTIGSDVLETKYFGKIDDLGAKARDALLDGGPRQLSPEQQVDFGRLLLSLESRRPTMVSRLRCEVPDTLAKSLDEDEEIVSACVAAGITERPSIVAQKALGSFDDRAMLMVPTLTDNRGVLARLLNAHWHTMKLEEGDGTLVLSDRPLIRMRAFDHPGAAWFLPLTPRAAFVAVNHPANLENVQRTPRHRVVRYINVASARQAEKYVFAVDPSHERWLPKYLKPAPFR